MSASSEADVRELQGQFPKITFLADEKLAAIDSFQVRHPGGAMPGDDRVIAYPTTFFIGIDNKVRWAYRSTNIMERRGVDELLHAIDTTELTGG